MLVLSDCPERLTALAPGGGWSERLAGSLPSGERELWRALGGGERLWRAPGSDPGPPGFWTHALILAEARSSQFDTLRERLAAGLRLTGPTACAALAGRGFHGQRGRPWLAAPGNLHLCAVFPRPALSARHLGSLPMLPAVALVEAIRATGGGALRPGIKWVNDVLLEGGKVGGVLTATQTQGERVDAVLLGIGLNVATAPPVPPTPFVPSVCSLAEAGSQVTWPAALAGLLPALGRRMSELAHAGPAALLDAYREASLVLGREVCVFDEAAKPPAPTGRWPAPLLRGVAREITEDLALVLEGFEAPVTKGRLAFAESCRRFGI